MKKLKNVLVAVLFAALLGASFTSCSDVEDSDSVAFSNANSVSRSVARSALENTKVISSDLNPGFGKAVFFTGTFYEGRDWTVALRGTYEDGKWVCNVTSYTKTFEYKALIGNWDEGETVNAVFTDLVELDEADILPGYQGMPSGYVAYDASEINYGEAVYFKHASAVYAVRGKYYDYFNVGYCPILNNVWSAFLDYGGFYISPKVIAYKGSYDLGEKVYPQFTTLEWEDGENHIYE